MKEASLQKMETETITENHNNLEVNGWWGNPVPIDTYILQILHGSGTFLKKGHKDYIARIPGSLL